MKRKKGTIIKVRMGYNANSSSLGATVTFLMLGATAALAIINMLAAFRFSKNKKVGKSNEQI